MTLREWARGKHCTIRLPGCVGGPDTVVLSHYPGGVRHGRGMGRKVSDLLTALACHACHDAVDGRRPAGPRDFLMVAWHDGHLETLKLMEEDDVVTTTGTHRVTR